MGYLFRTQSRIQSCKVTIMTLIFDSCPRCLMDDSALNWKKEGDGCNYCELYLKRLQIESENKKFETSHAGLNAVVAKVKESNRNSAYDGVFGLSGGLDSCYALHRLVQMGIRPLVVHMDNGWNTELAQHNIGNILSELNLDFETHIIKWSVYRKLQKAFLASDVLDIELLYDQAAAGVCSYFAKKHDCHTILTGSNHSTEGMPMPENWSYINKLDSKNIKSIWKQFGDGSDLQTYPFYSTGNYIKDLWQNKLEWVSILDYLEYNRESAIQELVEIYDFKPYPFKHYESVFTRFYQGFLLPEKFKVDKRKVHFSSLVLSGQITREEAILQLATSAYLDQETLQADRQYFLKKINWSEADLENYIKREEKAHTVYGNDMKFYKCIFLPSMKLLRFFRSPLTLRGKIMWLKGKFNRILTNFTRV
jgi:N-acetyl sugar amidotransferase